MVVPGKAEMNDDEDEDALKRLQQVVELRVKYHSQVVKLNVISRSQLEQSVAPTLPTKSTGP
jgi:hypothetical protein